MSADVKATKTHEVAGTCRPEDLLAGDLVRMRWFTQKDDVWLRVVGLVGFVPSLFPSDPGVLHVLVLPPSKDAGGPVVLPMPPYEVDVKRARVAAPEPEQLEVRT